MPRRSFAIGLIALLGAAFGASQFLRTAPAVVAPALRRELGLSPETIGLVFGLFFVAFTLVHIPVGAMLDRHGPRRVMSLLLFTAALGTFIFSVGESPAVLIAGQMLSGLGTSVAFVGGLTVVGNWFPRERFGQMAAWIGALSTLGPVLSGTPFALLVEAIGWRDAWRIAGVAFVAMAGLVFALVRDAPPGHAFHARAPERLGETLRGILPILAVRQVWGIIAFAFVGFAVQIAVRGLWGGPYLEDVHGLGAIERGNILLAMSIASTAGAVAFGVFEGRRSARIPLVCYGSGTIVAAYAVLAALPSPGAAVTIALFCIVGLAGPYTILLLAHARALFPDRLTGRAITTVNMANFLGVSVMQIVPGWILGAFPPVSGHPPEIAYRTMFGVLAAVLVVALLIFLRWGARPKT